MLYDTNWQLHSESTLEVPIEFILMILSVYLYAEHNVAHICADARDYRPLFDQRVICMWSSNVKIALSSTITVILNVFSGRTVSSLVKASEFQVSLCHISE